jgi:hypothetical protein
MRLVHYSNTPLGPLRHIVMHAGHFFKPSGLWVSDDDCEINWRSWCVSEGYRLDCLTHAHDVQLARDANVLILKSASDIDSFHTAWKAETPILPGYNIRWKDLQNTYAGVIITPYINERRLAGPTRWYYGWDCASGCIWDPAAIANVTLREVVPAPEPAP